MNAELKACEGIQTYSAEQVKLLLSVPCFSFYVFFRF